MFRHGTYLLSGTVYLKDKIEAIRKTLATKSYLQWCPAAASHLASEPTVHVSSPLYVCWHHISSLKVATAEGFTPEKLADATKKGFFFFLVEPVFNLYLSAHHCLYPDADFFSFTFIVMEEIIMEEPVIGGFSIPHCLWQPTQSIIHSYSCLFASSFSAAWKCALDLFCPI